MPLSILLATSLLGCGALASGDWRGEVLAEIAGTVVVEEGSETPEGELRVALFWSTPEGEPPIEQDVETWVEFPAAYTLTLFSPPPEQALQESQWAAGLIAVGAPMLYWDEDGDQRWDDTEAILGVSIDRGLVYSTDALEVLEGYEEGEELVEDTDLLDPGYHVLESDEGLCSYADWLPYTRAESEQVDIYVGEYVSSLLDYDCDGDIGEWEWLDDDDEGEDDDDGGGEGGGGEGGDDSGDDRKDCEDACEDACGDDEGACFDECADEC
jgi:hypothetical protein